MPVPTKDIILKPNEEEIDVSILNSLSIIVLFFNRVLNGIMLLQYYVVTIVK